MSYSTCQCYGCYTYRRENFIDHPHPEEDGMYWVRQFPNSEWEIAQYLNDFWTFFNCEQRYPDVFQFDPKPIKKE